MRAVECAKAKVDDADAYFGWIVRGALNAIRQCSERIQIQPHGYAAFQREFGTSGYHSGRDGSRS